MMTAKYSLTGNIDKTVMIWTNRRSPASGPDTENITHGVCNPDRLTEVDADDALAPSPLYSNLEQKKRKVK